jgi:hypothetical protein
LRNPVFRPVLDPWSTANFNALQANSLGEGTGNFKTCSGENIPTISEITVASRVRFWSKSGHCKPALSRQLMTRSRRWMFDRIFGLDGRESYRELRREPHTLLLGVKRTPGV